MNEQPKYSRKEFEGYTHRFIVRVGVDGDWRNDSNINIYSNSESKVKLGIFLYENKSAKVKSFEIVHISTKEQDGRAAIFIEEFLKELN